jgi:PBP1b-binding outer membrane lipoprotein LpoB
MKYLQNSLICVLLVSLALIAGCSREPTDEMNKAEEAVARADNDPDAVNYSGNLIAQAKDSLDLMYDEADAKNYDAVLDHAANAISYADRAINEGRFAASRARDEANSVISSLRSQIQETGQRIDTAKAANLPLDFGSIDSDFNSAQRTFDQAQSAMSGSRYQEAIFLCNSVRSSLNAVNQKLGNAAMEVSRKK